MDQVITTSAPASVVGSDGSPAFGAYRGYSERVSWGGLAGSYKRGPLWRRLHQKTWHYASIATAECVVALAVIDVGFASSAFAYVFDRRARRLLANLSFTALRSAASFTDFAGPGASTRFTTRKASFGIEAGGQPGGARDCGHDRGHAAWHVQGRAAGRFELDALLHVEGAPPPLCAVAEIAGGVGNCTHKTPGLVAQGSVAVGPSSRPTRFDLDGGACALDHTRGLLARDTRWRWASATRQGLSLNLVEDFNGPVENVVWIDDELVPIGAVTFAYNAKATSEPWRILAANGSLELEFTPEGERREDKNLVVAKSWYVQPIGTFRGVVRPPGRDPIEVRDLAGVTEDHIARW